MYTNHNMRLYAVLGIEPRTLHARQALCHLSYISNPNSGFKLNHLHRANNVICNSNTDLLMCPGYLNWPSQHAPLLWWKPTDSQGCSQPAVPRLRLTQSPVVSFKKKEVPKPDCISHWEAGKNLVLPLCVEISRNPAFHPLSPLPRHHP